MSEFTWTPSYGSRLRRKPRTLEAQFGDGYVQRMADGINANPQVWELRFDSLDSATADAIEAFLEALGGHTPFDWTPPGKSAARFVCTEWERDYADYTHNPMRMTFVEDFAP